MDEREHGEIAAGADAAELLNSRAFKAARAQILDGIAAKRRTVAITDEKMMLRLILLEQCWHTIEAYLQQCKETGEMTRFQLDQKEQGKVSQFFGRLRA